MELNFNKTATACLAHVLRNTPTVERVNSRHLLLDAEAKQ